MFLSETVINNTSMNQQQYLKRIRYTGSLKPDIETLCNLQAAHLFHVPFENLDIHSNTPVDLSKTFAKVVERKRGGFCYELNSLFCELLKALGFVVKLTSARVYSEEKGYGPEYDHMAIIAQLQGEQYLVDVGFGEFALQPLAIRLDQDQIDPRGVFRLERYDPDYLMVKKKDEQGQYVPEYIFSETERQIEEFYEMCHYHQTSSESHFTQKRVCTLPTQEGRITLTGTSIRTTVKGNVTTTQLTSEAEVKKALKQYFRIEL